MPAWLTFLNAGLLLGGLAFAIPLVIHLLNRSRFTTIDWGAMLFLDEALRANSRRIEWQKWLLLLMRCAIPVVLALCMARPLLQNSLIASRLPGGESTATYLLIDSSLSLERSIPQGADVSAKAFDAAKTIAGKMIQASNRSSRWAISPLAPHPSQDSSEINASPVSPEKSSFNSLELVSRDLTRHREFLEAMSGGMGSSDLLAAIEEAAVRLEKSTESQRQIVVISDFQRSMCQAIEPSQVTALRQRYEGLANPPSIIFLPITPPEATPQTIDNLTVRIDRATASLVGVGQLWEIRLLVKNFGEHPAQRAKLVLAVDGTSVAAKSLDVPARAESQIAFSMTFAQHGSHRLVATLEVDDALAADNVATWSVLALDTIPVLIVDPFLEDRQQNPESDFLQAALAPFEEDPKHQANLFRVSRIRPEEWKSDKLNQVKIVVLAGVAKLDDAAVEPLVEHVQNGGVLMIFAGEKLDSSWYNRRLARSTRKTRQANQEPNEPPFLPFLFDQNPQSLKPEQPSLKFLRETFQHPAIRFLNDTRIGSLDSLEVRSWYRLLPNVSAEGEQATKLLSFVNGDLFLAERAYGAGSILQCATTCSDRWTNWPMRPIYLPMMQQMLLASTPPVRWPINVETGQRLQLPSPPLCAWIDGKDGEPHWRLPSGSSTAARSLVADAPGIYKLEGITESPLYLSAQPPIAESDLTLESSDGLQSLADRLGATIAGSPEELASLQAGANRELWRWFLLCLLALLFGEIFLQRYLSGGMA